MGCRGSKGGAEDHQPKTAVERGRPEPATAPGFSEELRGAFDAPDATVRRDAVVAVGEMMGDHQGTVCAEAVVKLLVGDDDEDVRSAAHEALRQMGTTSSVDIVAGLLVQWLDGSNPKTRYRATLALRQRGPARYAAQTHLDLSWSGMGASGAESFADQGLPSGLVHLNLCENGFGPAEVRAFAAAWKAEACANLTHLDLRGNRFGSAGAEALAEAGLPPGLLDLNLVGNELGAKGARALAEAWPPGLVHLNLRYNGLGPEGAEALAEAWKAGAGAKMQHLDLSKNRLGQRLMKPGGETWRAEDWEQDSCRGLQALADAWKAGACANVRHLDLSSNSLGEKVEDLPTLDQLQKALDEGRITEEKIIERLEVKSWRERVTLGPRSGIEALAEAWKAGGCGNLAHLDLCGNDIGSKGAKVEMLIRGLLPNVRNI